jgi:hypothetical protein
LGELEKALSGLKAERKLSEARVALPASERLKALAQRRQGEVDGSEERTRPQALRSELGGAAVFR